MFKVYSKGNNNEQSDGNQVLQNIIGKIGKVESSETVNEDQEEILYVTLTKLANKLKDMHDTLQWTRDEPSSGNRGSTIDDILDEIKEVMSELIHLNKHYNKSVDEQLSKKKKITNKTSVGMVAEDEASDLYHDNVKGKSANDLYHDNVKSGKDYNDYKGIQIHNLRKELKRVRKILLNLQDIEGKDNSSDMVQDIRNMLSGYQDMIDNMESAFEKLEIGRHRKESTEEGVMSTIGQGIDNVAVGAGKMVKKGAKKAAPHVKKGVEKGLDATKKGLKKGLNKLSKIGSKNTSSSFDGKGKATTNVTYGMANATNESVAADIKDYIDDHKEHFDAYPQDVEVDDKVYDWDEYWAILDKVYPDAYDNQYANESVDESDIEKMQDAYKYNEDRNAHSENILMLAHSFATRPEIKAIEGLLKITKQQGYVTPEQSEIMYNSIHKKYIGELFPIEESAYYGTDLSAVRQMKYKDTVKVTDIQWDADDMEDIKQALRAGDLRRDMIVPIPADLDDEEVDEYISDFITDKTGWTHKGFNIEEGAEMHISPDIAKAHTLKHTFSPIDTEKYQERDGLEGPIMTKAGKVLYYDNKEGKYLDPDTDIYLSYEEWKNLSESEYIDHFDSMAAKIQKESILHYSDAKGTRKYSEGYKAAKDGVKYDENPYSGIEKLQWSRGHNDERADRLSAAGEPNYGARGQFETVEEAYNPETGRDPNVDTTEWDDLIAKAKKKQKEKKYANSKAGKRDPAYRHYHQYKTQ
jgi:CHAD domain-containing protein